ncbi:hypothetical protein [Methylobacterium sp. ID0610]|uniref:hypothetical protein n=1 Tax=Methylobacterium carpenticola TaxID=3344827 RepID=UPI0036BF3318
MAFSGVHVAFGFAFTTGDVGLFGAVWSQTLSASGTTTNAAVGLQFSSPIRGDASPCFEVRAQQDCYVAVGATPDASQTIGTDGAARVPVGAGETRHIPCKPGDKLAVVLV